jgi:hypothetical protein
MALTVFSILTGVILTLAAILTYLIQRARYLREIEPDLDLTWPTSVRVEQMAPTLKEFWSMYIDIKVVNKSDNHATDLRPVIHLDIFPSRGDGHVLSAELRELLRLHPEDLLARRETVVPVYVACNTLGGDELYRQIQSWGGAVEVEKAGFEAAITLEYSSHPDLALWVLLPPWNAGRKKYRRTVRGSWGFVVQDRADPPYVSRPWHFPEKSLDKI